MVRIKRGTTALKRRKNILKKVKGFRWSRSKKERAAKEALLHAGKHAFAHRRAKKNDFRRLWNIQIGAAAKSLGLSYSKIIHSLTKRNIKLNRKMLATLARENPDIFEKVVKE